MQSIADMTGRSAEEIAQKLLLFGYHHMEIVSK